MVAVLPQLALPAAYVSYSTEHWHFLHNLFLEDFQIPSEHPNPQVLSTAHFPNTKFLHCSVQLPRSFQALDFNPLLRHSPYPAFCWVPKGCFLFRTVVVFQQSALFPLLLLSRQEMECKIEPWIVSFLLKTNLYKNSFLKTNCFTHRHTQRVGQYSSQVYAISSIRHFILMLFQQNVPSSRPLKQQQLVSWKNCCSDINK